MMHDLVPSHVWQRRTHKIIALAVIIIGLTMMISTIPQCIYIGLIFIMLSLVWLIWMKLTEKKIELPISSQPHGNLSPVLFLVASQNFTPRSYGPTHADPNDKPPSYDQILKLDGLPPDYLTTILANKPPRYEDVAAHDIKWPVTIPIEVDLGNPVSSMPSVHSFITVNNQTNHDCHTTTGPEDEQIMQSPNVIVTVQSVEEEKISK